MKLLSFSQYFPAYHKRAGEKTCFPEQIMNTFGIEYNSLDYFDKLVEWNNKALSDGKLCLDDLTKFFYDLAITDGYKIHTIRSKTQINVGEQFQPFVWSRKPYCSPIIKFMQPLTLLNKQTVLITPNIVSVEYGLKLNRHMIAKNDGLNVDDFDSWFSQQPTFGGYILDFVTGERYGSENSHWKE